MTLHQIWFIICLSREPIRYDTYPFPICPADRLDVMITDWDASEDDLKLFDEKGIEIVIVEKEEGIR